MLGNWVEYATGLRKEKRSIPMTEGILMKIGKKIGGGFRCGDALIGFSRFRGTIRPLVGFIKYEMFVHDLQHALRMCGINKDIIL